MKNQKIKKHSLVKNLLKFILGIAVFCLALTFFSNCSAKLANLVPPIDVIPRPTPRAQPTQEPLLKLIFVQLFIFLKIFCINFIANTFILIISYFILKQIKLIKCWRFLKYIFCVTIGSALIDLIYVGGLYLTKSKGILDPGIELMGVVLMLMGSVFLTFLGLLFYNYWLSRKFFNLTKKQAIFIGIIMGIFTHPFFGSILQQSLEWFRFRYSL